MTDEKTHTFHWADYLVLVIFLGLYASVGFFFGWRDRRKMTARHFFTASAQMHWVPVALSMQVSTRALFAYYSFSFLFAFLLVCFIALDVHRCLTLSTNMLQWLFQ